MAICPLQEVVVMDEERRVMEVNRLFYQALSDLDIQAMEEVWLHDDYVSCVHPGWPALHGWGDVRGSWLRIFANTMRHRVEPGAVSITVMGEVGWVTCSEHISTVSETGESVSLAAANNLFVRTPLGWKMVLHHASQVPVESAEPLPPLVH